MKIVFDDSSFLEISRNDKDILLIMCGKKGNKVTMTSATLNNEQIHDIIDYLLKQPDQNEKE